MRESADEADEDERQAQLPPTKKELAQLAKEKKLADVECIKTMERKKAEIEAELARLKKQK